MRVDHLVWYCPALSDGEAYFTSRADRPPAFGGIHPGEGTQNSLLSFGDATYLEILAPDPAQAGAGVLDKELAGLAGQGLYHWAAGGVNLSRIIELARSNSLEVSDIVSGGRRLPNGKWLGWKLAGLRNHGFGALVPFFIDWTDCEHPALSAPSGGRFAKIELSTPNAGALNRLFRAIGLDLTAGDGEKPRFAVTLECAAGPVVLNSFDPLPRGFVI
jgi:hypothetical protein